MKKLDNIILALDDGEGDGTRLESAIKTRETLIHDPNSKAHLRIGKLKSARRRANPTGAMHSGSGSGEASGDDSHEGSGSGSGGSEGTALRLARPKAARMSSGGVEGLLEAAASLSDGETPGTPTIGPGGIPSRSPRISGLLSAIGGEDMGSAAAEAAAALGALKPGPGGAFAPVPKGAPAAAPAAVAAKPTAATPPAALNSVNHVAALAAALDPNAYAAAIAAFAKAAPVPAAAQFPGLNPQLLVAWMTAAGMAPQPQPAAHAASPWNPAAIQQLAAQLAAAQQQGAAASGSAHQPL